MDIPFHLSFLFLLLYSMFFAIRSRFTIKKYLYILLISYAYSIYFIWRMTSPIWNGAYFTIIAIAVLFLLIRKLTKRLNGQIAILLTAISFGHLLYCTICRSYHLQYTIDETQYYLILFAVILVLAIQHSWHYCVRKLEHYINLIELKKRWNT
ncbi:hypothetical protein SH601_08900 [Gracilibacillus sp. S3-1-1]|uniref:Uncharacterized protein n=2 Tax=Gracilibacillus pellucidus TaxID=3095368 RepID=A0ACC6M5D9_9BACI|nr:hypothetical protein [Gracilibacillus sp. S3-1-1]MDX8046106.1 hypothetical protein [Gracilibacillus sp. S3-1-1]